VAVRSLERGLAPALFALGALCACAGGPRVYSPPPRAEVSSPEPAPGAGQEIVACGERFGIGVPVVLWTAPGGYDAYSSALRFPGEAGADAPQGLRYRPGRETGGRAVGAESGSEALSEVVDLLVVHYDACGHSRTCFQVLHDRRGLSAHFLLDVDGTLYQTLDLAETAWHARQANPRSIGIEIASIGAYPPGHASPIDAWYDRDELGMRLNPPLRGRPSGVRTEGFVARPIRAGRIRGAINGAELEMVDLTPQQYHSLSKLTAALCELFPRIAPDAPRDDGGAVRPSVLSDEELARFSGILGHWHVSADKVDPGPAFDWERFLGRVRALLDARAVSRPAAAAASAG